MKFGRTGKLISDNALIRLTIDLADQTLVIGRRVDRIDDGGIVDRHNERLRQMRVKHGSGPLPGGRGARGQLPESPLVPNHGMSPPLAERRYGGEWPVVRMVVGEA